ncbi:MAG: DnaJ domain-containing protein [Deltaproteobacteria bacterium]|nr:DnaJ domain-containing protein [Deltaproteobacteria bacterium]
MGQEAFIDYYEILQVSPRADQETIERVYRLLAKRYHPDNKKTGNAEKFDELTKAYRALSNPERRAGYDAKYEAGNAHQWSVFTHESPSEGAEEDRRIYQAILSILYNARRRDADNPGVGIFQLEKLLDVPEKNLEFHTWYLREKNWIHRVENGSWAITASGVDTVIENGHPLKKDRLLPAVNGFPSAPDDLKTPGEDLLNHLEDRLPS